jgi:glycosyltransferase involved in cell wall biosynthesis
MYLTFVDKERDPGVYNKISYQVKGFKKLGYDVSLSYMSGNEFYINDKPVCQLEQNKLRKFANRFFLPKKIKKIFLNENYDIFYVRKSFINISVINFFKNLKNKGTIVILEIPTFPYSQELKGTLKKTLYSYEVLCSKLLKKNIDLITFYGEELESIWGCPTLRLENGVDVESIKFSGQSEKIQQGGVINLIGVGNLSPWHGFERVIRSIYSFRNNQDQYLRFVFHVVGEGIAYKELKNLVNELDLSDSVKFYGFKSGEELDSLYEKSHIAIGSLGFFKIGLSTGSTLKSKEYAARGIPFIIGHKDIAFEDKSEFVFEVNNDDSEIDLKQVYDWINNIVISTSDIRRFAVDNLTWDIQLKKLNEKILLMK